MIEKKVFFKSLIKQLNKIKEDQPEDIFKQVYSLRGISIRCKLSLAAACLRDGKAIYIGYPDPFERTSNILSILRGLEKCVARLELS